ncbi:MAG: hypothetical protein GY820_09155 [Gammaproteobacteria bacterium]|nr:hypothetical protein [Gammaproteobacteria bacterium]
MGSARPRPVLAVAEQQQGNTEIQPSPRRPARNPATGVEQPPNNGAAPLGTIVRVS